MVAWTKGKSTVKKVTKALKKASNAHAKQAKNLAALKLKKGGSVKKKKKKGGATPTNPALYARVKAEAKRKFKVYPSAYANAWLVRTYKKRGGGYRSWVSFNNMELIGIFILVLPFAIGYRLGRQMSIKDENIRLCQQKEEKEKIQK